MIRCSRAGAALFTAIAVASCGHGNTATGPGSQENDAVIVFAGLDVSGKTDVATLTHVQLLWDGTVVDDVSGSPSESLFLEATFTTTPGAHTISVKVVGQTVSSAVYTLTATISAGNTTTGAEQSVLPPTVDRTITTGASSGFSVTLN